MSTNKSIKRNYIYNASYQCFSLLAPLITMPYISRTLKAEGVGTASFIGSIVHYFVIVAALGIYIYGKREISYLQDDRTKRSWIFWNLKALAAITVSLSLTAFLVLAHMYAGKNYYLYLISGMSLINIVLNIDWFYAGMEDFGKLAIKNIMIRAIHLIFLLTFIKSEADLAYYMGSSVFLTTLGHIVLWMT